MSSDTSPTPSDWRKSITLPPGFFEHLREQFAKIDRAGIALRDLDWLTHPTLPEVRLRPLGEVIAEIMVAQAPPPQTDTPNVSVGYGKLSWQAARDRLIDLRGDGQSFTSLRDLAARIGCSDGLIRKAIKSDTGLRAWAASATRTRRTAPAATSLDHALRRMPQRREAAPNVDVADSDAPVDEDVVLQRLIDAASPAERARLHSMPPGELRSLLRLVGEQDADHDRARLRKRA